MSLVISMLIDYDVKRLSNVLQDFYGATGINIQIVKDDFSPMVIHGPWHTGYCNAIQSAKQGEEGCRCSDRKLFEKCRETRKMQIHTCHAGLIDVAVPIIFGSNIIGYIVLGEMKKDADFSAARKFISHLSLDMQKMEKEYEELTFFDSDKIQSVANLAQMLAKYVLLENMLRPGFNRNIEKAVNFIDANLDKSLSVQYISESINVSKSVLYKYFRDFFDCTLSEYITKKRIEKSVELLLGSDLSIEEISKRVGFSSAAYYTMNFKKQKGITPFKFKTDSRKAILFD